MLRIVKRCSSGVGIFALENKCAGDDTQHKNVAYISGPYNIKNAAPATECQTCTNFNLEVPCNNNTIVVSDGFRVTGMAVAAVG